MQPDISIFYIYIPIIVTIKEFKLLYYMYTPTSPEKNELGRINNNNK